MEEKKVFLKHSWKNYPNFHLSSETSRLCRTEEKKAFLKNIPTFTWTVKQEDCAGRRRKNIPQIFPKNILTFTCKSAQVDCAGGRSAIGRLERPAAMWFSTSCCSSCEILNTKFKVYKTQKHKKELSFPIMSLLHTSASLMHLISGAVNCAVEFLISYRLRHCNAWVVRTKKLILPVLIFRGSGL